MNQEESQKSIDIKYDSLGLTLHCLLNTEPEKIQSNIEKNIQRGYEQVWPYAPQDTPLAICAGGPSLLETLDELREAQDNGAKVIALSNAAHILKDNNIHYSAHILLDAKPNNASFVHSEPDSLFLIASQCDPCVFDAAEKTGNKILIWHAVNHDDEFELLHDHYDKWVPVQGGATIVYRALRLMNILGYSKFDMYGFDSCFMSDEDGKEKHHAYDQPDADKQPRFNLKINDRTFIVAPWMINQLMEFQKVCKMFGQQWQMNVHGDGMIRYVLEEISKDPSIKTDIEVS